MKREAVLQLDPQAGQPSIHIGYGALDARNETIFIVDAAMQLVFVTSSGEKLLALGDTLCLLASSDTGERVLSATRQVDAAALRHLVRAVAVEGKPKGAHRLMSPGAGGRPGLALTVELLPKRSVDNRSFPEAMPGLAMVVAVDLRRGKPPCPEMLRQLFGMTRAEASVAAALSLGVTAEQVSQTRGVALDTVRTQIRVILHKIGATGLRDLERIMALLPRAF